MALTPRRFLMNLLTITRRILKHLLTITRRILMNLLTITRRILMHLLTILLLPSQGLLLVIPSLITRDHLMKSMILPRQTR